MPVYRVIRKSDEDEVTRYAAAAPARLDEYPLDQFDHVVFDPENPAPVEPPPDAWHITRLAFLSRFTDAEAITIDLASQHDPAATGQQKQQAAAMRRYLQKVNAATFIDLKRPDTRSGVQALEAAGLIGSGRAAAILDALPTETELYRG